MKHKIIVPDEYGKMEKSRDLKATSDIECYIEAFERNGGLS